MAKKVKPHLTLIDTKKATPAEIADAASKIKAAALASRKKG